VYPSWSGTSGRRDPDGEYTSDRPGAGQAARTRSEEVVNVKGLNLISTQV